MNSPVQNVSLKPGQMLPLSISGTTLSFTIITGSVAWRGTKARKFAGPVTTAAAGFTWTDLDFDVIELINLSSTNSCAVQCVIGGAGFQNNQLIISQSQGQNVAYPTCPTVNSSTRILIPDLSGGTFFDVNGNKWIALNRIAIEGFNADAGVTLFLQKFTPAGGSPADPAIGIVYPLTPIKFEFSGNYRFDLGGATINAIVNEIYNAIPST
jgi:hypothetical protein